MAILLAVMALNLRPLYDPLADATNRVEGFIKQTRAKAMATTSAYRIRISGNQLVGERAKRCSDTSWTPDSRLVLELPRGVTITSNPSVPLCFSSRGYATTPMTYTLSDAKGRTRQLQVFIGGAVRRP